MCDPGVNEADSLGVYELDSQFIIHIRQIEIFIDETSQDWGEKVLSQLCMQLRRSQAFS